MRPGVSQAAFAHRYSVAIPASRNSAFAASISGFNFGLFKNIIPSAEPSAWLASVSER